MVNLFFFVWVVWFWLFQPLMLKKGNTSAMMAKLQ